MPARDADADAARKKQTKARSRVHSSLNIEIGKTVLRRDVGQQLCAILGIPSPTPGTTVSHVSASTSSNQPSFLVRRTGNMPLSNCAKHLSQIFDPSNASPGPKGEVATHTFDVSTLVSGEYGDRWPEVYEPVIARWRDKGLGFVVVWGVGGTVRDVG